MSVSSKCPWIEQDSTAYVLPCRTWLSRRVNHDNSVKNLRKVSKRIKMSFNDVTVTILNVLFVIQTWCLNLTDKYLGTVFSKPVIQGKWLTSKGGPAFV